MAFNFDPSDPKTQKTIAILMVPIVLMAFFYVKRIKPRISEIAEKTAEVNTISQQVRRQEKSLRPIKEMNAEKETLLAKYDEFEKFLPSEENVALLLDQLSAIERFSKVYLVEFNATESIESGDKPYRANKYRITIEAGYHQFADFMSSIMTLPRILSFSDLRISTNTADIMGEEMNEGLADQPRNLSIEFIMTSYVFTMAGNEEL